MCSYLGERGLEMLPCEPDQFEKERGKGADDENLLCERVTFFSKRKKKLGEKSDI